MFMNIHLPDETHHFEDGSFMVPEDYTDFVDDPAPSYAINGPDFVSENPDGSMVFEMNGEMEQMVGRRCHRLDP